MDFSPLNENYISVVTVPANVAPISQPSEAIKRLLTKRQKGHNFMKNSLNLELEKLNLEIEAEIRKEYDRLKENLEKLKRRIEEEDNRIFRCKTNEELISLNSDIWETILPTVEWLNEQRLEAIENFHESLKTLEKSKLKKIKKIFQSNYKKMGEISHLAPFELLEFFETESLRINEISMSNHRHYIDLVTQLKLQISEEMRRFNMAFIETKEKYKMAIIQDKDINVKKKEEIDETTLLPPIDCKCENVENVRLRAEKMSETLADLDGQAKKIINLYKSAIFHIFNRFFEGLKTVTERLESDSLTNITCDSFNNVTNFDEITELENNEFEGSQRFWYDIIDYMETDIQKTKIFLKHSAHLWDTYFQRETNLKSLILDDLNLEIEKNDKSSQIFERKINAVLDELREGSNLKQLEKKLKQTNKILDSIQKLYSNQCDREIKILEKFRKMTDQSIELLISEIDQFLEENARVDDKKQDLNGDSDDIIPYQMRTCKYQVGAVNNWMFGLWETLRSYMRSCHNEMTIKTNLWMDEITVKLKKRLEIKLSTTKPRYQRVKLIFDARLNEIKTHEMDFQNFEKSLLQYLENPTIQTREKCLQILQTVENFITEIYLKLEKTVNSQEVSVYIEKVKVAALDANRHLEENLNEIAEKLEENRLEVNKLICVYNQLIQLFIDGGNYNRDEAKIYKKKLQKITKTIPGKFEKIQQDFKSERKDILEKLEKLKEPALRRLELWKNEFENNEITCHKIKKCQNSIRNYAYEMKFHLHRAEAYIDDFAQQISQKPQSSDTVKESFCDCLEKLTLVTDFLTDEENGYLIRINRLIDDAFEEIGVIARNFYGCHGAILNQKMVQPTVEMFLEEVAKNFDGFKVQIKVHLWENLQELIELSIRFVKIVDCGFLETKEQINRRRVVEGLLEKSEKNLLRIGSGIEGVKVFVKQLLDFMRDRLCQEPEIK